jgi:hypothetical protein
MSRRFSFIFTATNQDGEFSFVISSTQISGPHNVTISPSKSSAGVVHTFEFNDQPVTSFSVYTDNLSFDRSVVIVDTASVNFVGTVSIGDTADYNGDKPCPVENATVHFSPHVSCDNDGIEFA